MLVIKFTAITGLLLLLSCGLLYMLILKPAVLFLFLCVLCLCLRFVLVQLFRFTLAFQGVTLGPVFCYSLRQCPSCHIMLCAGEGGKHVKCFDCRVYGPRVPGVDLCDVCFAWWPEHFKLVTLSTVMAPQL